MPIYTGVVSENVQGAEAADMTRQVSQTEDGEYYDDDDDDDDDDEEDIEVMYERQATLLEKHGAQYQVITSSSLCSVSDNNYSMFRFEFFMLTY